MAETANKATWRHLQRGWLTGPIFDKELRVSSRRRRNYVLRLFYILLLTAFVALVWMSMARYQGNATFQQSRMALAGKEIVTTIVIFQFIATQLLAAIMLSTSISDEIYHRTLGLLMTTPVSSLQIVMGKVLSKLLQLVLLLAISLPMLAIVRVFGGVSWDYLLSSLCITLTTVLFAGSVSLFLSIKNRRAYAVICRTIFVLGTFYFVLPGIAAAAWHFALPRAGFSTGSQSWIYAAGAFVLLHLNPVYSIAATTHEMLSPSGFVRFLWPLHCLLMLGLSALILSRAVAVVRRVALRQATGQTDVLQAKKRKQHRTAGTGTDGTIDGAVKRVHGPPVIWRELRAPFIQGVDNRNNHIGLAITLVALMLTYLASELQGYLDEGYAQTSYGLLFVFMGLLLTVVFSATRITTEKESQTWSLLLATPLGDWDILLGKAISAFRRCLPIWGLLGGHVLFFVLVGYIHPIALVHLLIVVAWLTCFITGAGLYFSSRFGRTTSAVVANFSLVLALWVVGPIVAGMLSIIGGHEHPFFRYMLGHPAVQTELLMSGASGSQNAGMALRALEYGSEHIMFGGGYGTFGVEAMTLILIVTGAIYIVAGLLFLWRAKCRLRRNIF